MGSLSLAVKYRPKTFSEVIGQDITVSVIEKEIDSGKIPRSSIFVGPAGTGKTSDARLMAEKINGMPNSYIEIDAASNNSVDDVREIIETAGERSISFKYKIYLIDECHMLSIQAWNAMLKLIEEPSSYTIFIFCTTDPQKIPATIISRCQVFRFNKISDSLIVSRLKYICECENIQANEDALSYIAKMAEGGMRQAITYLDKCKDYSNNITIDVVKSILGNYTYDVMFDLINSLIDGNNLKIFNTVEDLYNNGTDLKLFVSKYLEFVLQLNKYFLLNRDISCTSIPRSYDEILKYTTEVDQSWFGTHLDKVLKIKQMIKNDSDIKTTLQVMLVSKVV